jgi:putative ubiquitin-RnfH superfamily antitoxin RatB of RatAB toxin-antitoxin module
MNKLFIKSGLLLRNMDINYTDSELGIFNKITAASSELAIQSYVIGGFVRDKIIGRPQRI